MRQLLILFFTIILFSNCNNKKSWSTAEREKGMKLCMDQSEAKLGEKDAKKLCTCLLTKAMSKYSTYQAADDAISDEEGTKMTQACVKEIGLKVAGEGGGEEDVTEEGGGKKKGGLFGGGADEEGGWSSTDKRKFLDECTPSAVNAGVDQQTAKTYCDCTLKKIQKKYKSYNAAMSMTSEELATIQKECAAGAQGGTDDN
jgi:hypothetical protein